jgi:hypothetical protein
MERAPAIPRPEFHVARPFKKERADLTISMS